MTVEHREPLPAASPRRRMPLGLIALAVAALVLAAAIGGVLWLRSYAPIATGSFFSSGPNTKRIVESEDDLFIDRATVILDFKSGRPFSFGTTVANHGRLPIQLEGIVPSDKSWVGALALDGLRLGTVENGFGEAEQVPFHPVTIEPGEELEINVVGHFQGVCEPPTATGSRREFVSEIELQYSYAGVFERTQWMPLVQDYAVECSFTQ